ncbi:MAG: hypothetical protein V3U16_07645 [Candidatus Neomarinimicrobiota bacterium]
MNTITVEKNSAVLNELLLILVASVTITLVPTVSHLINIPLYKLNPMHWIIYVFCLSQTRRNGSILVLSIALPLVSFLTTGHPVLFKAILMGVELFLYGAIFHILYQSRNKGMFNAFIISKLIGITIYYTGKSIFVMREYISGPIITVPLISQIAVSIGIFVLLWIITLIRNISLANNTNQNSD